MPVNPIVPSPAHGRTRATVIMSTAADGLSEVLDLGGLHISSYCLSTSWGSTSISFRGSHISTDEMRDIYLSNDGTQLIHHVNADSLVSFNVRTEMAEGIRYLQFRSGPSSAPVAQTAAQEICVGLHNGM